MTVTTEIDVEALFEELSRIEGKGEIVDGKVVEITGSGPWPGDTAALILFALFQYVKRTKGGHAVGDRNTFRVNMPHRLSFSPDVAYHTGSRIPMKYYEGAPAFAVEIRSENDYGRPCGTRDGAEAGRLFCRRDAGGVGCRSALNRCRAGVPRHVAGRAYNLSPRRHRRSRTRCPRMDHGREGFTAGRLGRAAVFPLKRDS